MAPRLELQELLVNLLGSSYVYFQPPPSKDLQFPCIVYKRDNENKAYADNRSYRNTIRYEVTVIDPNPDSEIPARVSALPMCSYDRFFAADKLNHDVFSLFF